MDAEQQKNLDTIIRRIDEVAQDTAHGKVTITIQGGNIVQILVEKSQLIRQARKE